MKRLFIAINLPDEVKNQIERIIGLIDSDFRWIPPENWHLTLVFLGSQPDEAFSGILEALKDTAAKYPAPDIELEKMIYGPLNKSPRMVWLIGTEKTSKLVGEMKNKLEDNLIKNRVGFKPENRPFNCHLTLARFRAPLRNYENIRKYENLNINFVAQSVDLMESHLNPFDKLRVDAERNRSIKPTGAEYEILTKIDLTK